MDNGLPPLNVVYDNRAAVGENVSAVIGSKRYGDIIWHRMSLREHAGQLSAGSGAARFLVLDSEEDLAALRRELQLDSGAAWAYLSARAGIKDSEAVASQLKKARYSRETLISHQAAPLLATFGSGAAFADFISRLRPGEAATGSELASPAPTMNCGDWMTDISVPENFFAFFSGSSETRSFNRLHGDRYEFVKTSKDKDKCRREYRHYHLLPEAMQRWFVLPYGYKDSGEEASYAMERLQVPDMAMLWIHSSLSGGEFARFLDKALRFVSERPVREAGAAAAKSRRDGLYLEKVRTRFAALEEHPEFARLDRLIAGGTGFSGLRAVVERYCGLYSGFPEKDTPLIEAVGHGDLCFSNILYDKRTELLKLVDPKGADNAEELWTDALYDLAKLSHSALGLYDFINNDRFTVQLDPSGRLALEIISPVLAAPQQDFVDRMEKLGHDIRRIRLYEASLFLSMLPLHMDHPRKVVAFVLNAIHIMDELEENLGK